MALTYFLLTLFITIVFLFVYYLFFIIFIIYCTVFTVVLWYIHRYCYFCLMRCYFGLFNCCLFGRLSAPSIGCTWKKNSIVFSICQHDGNKIVFSVWRVSLVVFCYFRYCYLIYIVFSVVVVVLMEFTSVIEAYHWRGDRFEEKMLFLPSLILSLCRQKGKEPLKKIFDKYIIFLHIILYLH